MSSPPTQKQLPKYFPVTPHGSKAAPPSTPPGSPGSLIPNLGSLPVSGRVPVPPPPVPPAPPRPPAGVGLRESCDEPRTLRERHRNGGRAGSCGAAGHGSTGASRLSIRGYESAASRSIPGPGSPHSRCNRGSPHPRFSPSPLLPTPCPPHPLFSSSPLLPIPASPQSPRAPLPCSPHSRRILGAPHRRSSPPPVLPTPYSPHCPFSPSPMPPISGAFPPASPTLGTRCHLSSAARTGVAFLAQPPGTGRGEAAAGRYRRCSFSARPSGRARCR